MTVISSPLSAWESSPHTASAGLSKFLLWPFQLLISAPTALFLITLTAMLLRHPDVAFYEIDRVAFGLLVLCVVSRALWLRQRILVVERATLPMIGLTVAALATVLAQPFDQETWSLLASKVLVPFALFHLAAIVFTDEVQFGRFETFAVLVLAYLNFTAIAFLVGAHSLIFPRFILDESLGFHADRARGPLLQAVANGVSLNILGLIALHALRRRRQRKIGIAILLLSLPVAILATMTRAVWLSFGATAVVLVLFSHSRRLRVRAFFVGAAVLVIGCVVLMSCDRFSEELRDRLEERGPVDFRQAVYAGGWDMFWQHPWTGWGFHRMPAELPRYVSGYQEKVLYPHNTYLEMLVEQGVVGLAMYVWLMRELWRLGSSRIPSSEKNGFLSQDFHRLWPLILGVYWVNAALVVMSYQFVNGLVFTMAGMLAAQRRRAELLQPC